MRASISCGLSIVNGGWAVEGDCPLAKGLNAKAATMTAQIVRARLTQNLLRTVVHISHIRKIVFIVRFIPSPSGSESHD
jgi:hypothetical protein